jgi:hypothetical protein
VRFAVFKAVTMRIQRAPYYKDGCSKFLIECTYLIMKKRLRAIVVDNGVSRADLNDTSIHKVY